MPARLPVCVRARVRVQVTPKFSVLDEDNICEGDVVTATITLQHPQLANDDAPVPPVYAPAFPKSREEEWRVFIVDERLRGGQKRIVMPAFDKVVVKKAKTDVTLRFQAPMKAGAYTYTVFVISTCYMGLDVRQEVTFSVEPRPKFTKLDAPAASAEEEEEDKDALLPELSLENMLGGARREVAEEDSDLEDMEDEGEEEAAGAPAASATAATADGSGAKATNNVAVSGKPLKSGAALKKAPAAEADDEFASIGMNRGKEKSKKGKPAAASASAVAAAAPGETTSA
ncbi:hypothetical protein EON62_03695 [archaeon]|nr:MAG: hypothetical protein EON62_03695 [archaeon]